VAPAPALTLVGDAILAEEAARAWLMEMQYLAAERAMEMVKAWAAYRRGSGSR
jgi:hypothetical protein